MSRRQAPSIVSSCWLHAPRTIGAIAASAAVSRRAGTPAATDLRWRAINASASDTISIMRS